MVQRFLKFVSLASIFLFISFITTTSSTAVDALIWDEKTTDNLKKPWTIYFNQPVRIATVSVSSIYVLNDSKKRIPTDIKIDSDQKSITITPKSSYKPGSYWLFIDQSVRSSERDTLEQSVWMPFKVVSTEETKKESSSSASDSVKQQKLKVKTEINDYFTTITVTTEPSVTTLYVNNTKMQYTGNSTFTLGMAGLKKGDKLFFKAYNSTNSLLLRENAEVK
jgi:hypothetical protein